MTNVHKQTGVVACALYAMAVATCLASKSDPTSIIFEQADLRSHYCQCMETDFPGEDLLAGFFVLKNVLFIAIVECQIMEN